MKIIQSQSHSASFNLAMEEYLFTHWTEELIFLYVNEKCVVMGRNQDVISEVDIVFCAIHAIPVFKRLSGGGTVYHDSGNLNYCFMSNRVPGESPLSNDFLLPIVNVLADLGVCVEIGIRNDLWLPGGNKVSGTASHIGKTRILHHGTLLYDVDLDMLENSLSCQKEVKKSRSIASVHSQVMNIRSYLLDKNLESPNAGSFFELFINKLLDYYFKDTLTELSEVELAMIKPIIPVG